MTIIAESTEHHLRDLREVNFGFNKLSLRGKGGIKKKVPNVLETIVIGLAVF